MQVLQGACEELAEQWPAQRQSLTAVLEPSLQINDSSGSCPASDAAMLSALAWAEAVVERCAVVDARTGRAAITELTSVMPQVRPLPPDCCMFEEITIQCHTPGPALLPDCRIEESTRHCHSVDVCCPVRQSLHVAAASSLAIAGQICTGRHTLL